MVKLRLRRKGRAHYPFYDIVAVNSKARRDGAYLERVGYFNPNTTPSTINFNAEAAIKWLNTGAQPTKVVEQLLSYDGVLLRRALTFKGKTEQEIEEAVAKHKANALARYNRRRDLRAKRKVNKAKAEEAAKNAEQSAE